MRTPSAATLTIAAVLALATVAGATPVLQRKANDAGFPAANCRYCHSFDTAHMIERARRLGISNLNCAACHGARLPKIGAALMNERGAWLLAEKKRLQAPEIDMTWLKSYVPAKKAASPRP